MQYSLSSPVDGPSEVPDDRLLLKRGVSRGGGSNIEVPSPLAQLGVLLARVDAPTLDADNKWLLCAATSRPLQAVGETRESS